MVDHHIIIDCDPGQDDAVALLLALASPDELRIVGITCVAGNVPLDLTQRNARRICELAGRAEMRVFAGCPGPMVRPLKTAEAVHGESGLDGVDLPDPTMPLQDLHAVAFIIDACRSAEDGEITLCPTGPMTNVATALVQAPDIRRKIREIVFMSGATDNPSNSMPIAGFIIYVDPHAAQVVMQTRIMLTMLGLGVTHKAITTPERLAAIRAIGSPVAEAVAGMLEFYDRHDIERYGMSGGPLHDPCVIAYLLAPEIFRGRDCHVEVETASELTIGQTVVDWWGVTGTAPNCHVVDHVDSDAFYGLLIERLGRF